jgi:2-polyprenyl-3-methyl-5-hydroxy-6-metoxy-1,4-benzoquinol methylase
VTSDCRPWRGESRLAYCLTCRVVQKPVSNAWLDEISDIYAAYAVYEQGGGAEQASFDTASGSGLARSQRIVAWLDKRGRLPETGALLDIGCGNGVFLRTYGRRNPGWRMMGLELDARNKTLVESIPGVTHLHVGPIQSLDQKFDLIVMIHALEHIPNPIVFLRSLLEKLNPEGRLLIQVPDLAESPFDLLIADHCSHFSASALDRVVRSAGFEVCELDATCVTKELTLLAISVGTKVATDKPKPIWVSSHDDARTAERHAEWMHQVLRHGNQLSPRVGIFGTSISGTWLASTLGGRVHFFVDEDPNRIGRTHLGKPIYSPAQAPRDVDILMPMRPEVATVIAARLATHRLRLLIPPAPGNPPIPGGTQK